MMKSEKEMIYFEEVDRIKVFRGVNKQLVLGRGINRNIMEFKEHFYLSLGGKEEKTKNPVMARVGDRTRTQERILRNDLKVKHTTLEFNSGGHFADAQKRLAKAVKWLLECT